LSYNPELLSGTATAETDSKHLPEFIFGFVSSIAHDSSWCGR